MTNCCHPDGIQDSFAYDCTSCREAHSFRLPRLSDFSAANAHSSSRLKNFYCTKQGSWCFQNFRNEFFLRTARLPFKWYFRPSLLCVWKELCRHYGQILEEVYGKFLRITTTEEGEVLLPGEYDQIEETDETVVISFNPSVLRSERDASELLDVSSAAENEDKGSSAAEIARSDKDCVGDDRQHSEFEQPSADAASSSDSETQPNTSYSVLHLSPQKQELKELTRSYKQRAKDNREPSHEPSACGARPSASETTPISSVSILRLNPEEQDINGGMDCGHRTQSGPCTEDLGGGNSPGDSGSSRNVTTSVERSRPLFYQLLTAPVKPSSGRYDIVSGKDQKVFSELQTKVREHNFCLLNRRTGFPARFVFRTMDVFPFDLEIIDSDSGQTEEDKPLLPKLDQASVKEILISGPSGFGKTTLCLVAAYHWACGFQEMKDFDLCLYCSLPSMSFTTDFSKELVSLYHAILGDSEVDVGTLGSVLETFGETTVLLLDGFDKLSESKQETVLSFVRNKPGFSKSTVVLTSGPTKDKTFQEMFKRRAYIRGCSGYYFRKILGYFRLEDALVDSLRDKMPFRKLDFLHELSPFFTVWAAKAFRDHYTDPSVFPNLYSLLGHAVEAAMSWMSYTKEDYADKLQTFGRMCFDSLVSGTLSMNTDKLLEAFGSEIQFFEKCMFLSKPGERNEDNNWTVSSKVLQVFFATLYLRNVWSTCEDREEFLKEVYCCSGCSGDYVVEQPDTVYYVGLIPEIVLKMPADMSLEESRFQMHYDVDTRIEDWRAFDSVHLLLRVKDRFLQRFGFTPLGCENKEIEGRFDFLFALLNDNPLQEFVNEYHCYENTGDESNFLKMDVGGEDRVLSVVLREKMKHALDRLYLDFSFSKLQVVFPFLMSLLTSFLKPNDSYRNMRIEPFDKFVFNMVFEFLDCSVLRRGVVRCTFGEKNSWKSCDFQVSVGEDVSSGDGAKPSEKGVRFSLQKLRPSVQLSSVEYSKKEFFYNRDEIQGFLREMAKDSADMRICVYVW